MLWSVGGRVSGWDCGRWVVGLGGGTEGGGGGKLLAIIPECKPVLRCTQINMCINIIKKQKDNRYMYTPQALFHHILYITTHFRPHVFICINTGGAYFEKVLCKNARFCKYVTI